MKIVPPNELAPFQAMLTQVASIKKDKDSIFDIARFPHWETSNSNIWAYYLDRNRDHGFGDDCLKELVLLLQEKTADCPIQEEDLADSYSVETEKSKIDIQILGPWMGEEYEWAIIIENKINHVLDNPLETYWNAVPAKRKIGVVLAPVELPIPPLAKGIEFVSITHHALQERISKALELPKEREALTTRPIAILQDFFLHLHNISIDMMKKNKLKASANTFFENHELFQDAQQYAIEMVRLNFGELLDTMRPYRFEITSNSFYPENRDLHFQYYPKPDLEAVHTSTEYLPHFRFWFHQVAWLQEGRIECFFELFGEAAKPEIATQIKEKLKEENVFTSLELEEGPSGVPGIYQQIGWLKRDYASPEGEDFYATVRALLQRTFFHPIKEGETENFVSMCARIFGEIEGAAREEVE